MADDGEVVSPLSFVIERLELWAGTNGAIRPCALPLRDELVSVNSLFPVLEAMSPVESKALNLSFAFYFDEAAFDAQSALRYSVSKRHGEQMRSICFTIRSSLYNLN